HSRGSRKPGAYGPVAGKPGRDDVYQYRGRDEHDAHADEPGASASGNRYRAVFTNTCSGTQTAITSGATLTVAAKGLSISGAKANDKVYDGDAVAAVDWSSANLVGVVAGESVSIDH